MKTQFSNLAVIAAMAGLGLAGCSGAPSEDSDAMVADQSSVSPTATAPEAVETAVTVYTEDTQALFDYLKSGEYSSFPVSDERHPSAGPHDEVRVFYNPAVAESLSSGAVQHPAGSMIVKEQYKEGDKEPYGWSVSIKTHEEGGSTGEGWYWIEFLDRDDISNVFPEKPGNGVADCAGCHTIGKDFVRSSFPK